MSRQILGMTAVEQCCNLAPSEQMSTIAISCGVKTLLSRELYVLSYCHLLNLTALSNLRPSPPIYYRYRAERTVAVPESHRCIAKNRYRYSL